MKQIEQKEPKFVSNSKGKSIKRGYETSCGLLVAGCWFLTSDYWPLITDDCLLSWRLCLPRRSPWNYRDRPEDRTGAPLRENFF